MSNQAIETVGNLRAWTSTFQLGVAATRIQLGDRDTEEQATVEVVGFTREVSSKLLVRVTRMASGRGIGSVSWASDRDGGDPRRLAVAVGHAIHSVAPDPRGQHVA